MLEWGGGGNRLKPIHQSRFRSAVYMPVPSSVMLLDVAVIASAKLERLKPAENMGWFFQDFMMGRVPSRAVCLPGCWESLDNQDLRVNVAMECLL